jgi:hypothetical protein
VKESHQHLDITEKEWQAMGHEKVVFPPIFFLPAVFIHWRPCFRWKFVINRARGKKGEAHMKTWKEMRLFILAVLLLAFTPSTALPWGWGTHAYFANQFGAFFGSQNLQEIYGAVLPDAYAAIPSLEVQEQFFWQTHYEFCDFVKKAKPVLPAVGRGFASHNEDSGADYSAHIQNLTLGTQGGYVIVKQYQLVINNILLFNKITESLPSDVAELVVARAAHAAVEVAVDLWLKREQDPAWGARLFLAASFRDPRIPVLLVKAYKNEIDKSVIRNAEAVFRQAAISYSSAFLFEEEVTVQLLAAQAADQLRQDVELISEGTLSLVVDPNDLAVILYAAMNLVKDDYSEELSATLGMIRANFYTMCEALSP